jgi:hypothetical protein
MANNVNECADAVLYLGAVRMVGQRSGSMIEFGPETGTIPAVCGAFVSTVSGKFP